jgi:hypothetical protein
MMKAVLYQVMCIALLQYYFSLYPARKRRREPDIPEETGEDVTGPRTPLPNEPIPPILISKNDPPQKLPLGQLYIQTHPFTQGAPSSSRAPPLTNSLPPYWPFKTLADFEQAEIFDEGELSNTAINRQLDLNHKLQGTETGDISKYSDRIITLRTANELRKILDSAQVLDEEKVRIESSLDQAFLIWSISSKRRLSESIFMGPSTRALFAIEISCQLFENKSPILTLMT